MKISSILNLKCSYTVISLKGDIRILRVISTEPTGSNYSVIVVVYGMVDYHHHPIINQLVGYRFKSSLGYGRVGDNGLSPKSTIWGWGWGWVITQMISTICNGWVITQLFYIYIFFWINYHINYLSYKWVIELMNYFRTSPLVIVLIHCITRVMTVLLSKS